MTKSNLEATFAGDSQAHMKYLIFTDQAEKDGFTNVARLFRANAYAEQVHATSHFKVLKKLAETSENLQVGINAETYEVEEIYSAFTAVVELQDERGAVRSTKWAREAEKIHTEMYTIAKSTVDNGQDSNVGKLYVCSVCSWTDEGEPPDNCPPCNAKKELVRTF